MKGRRWVPWVGLAAVLALLVVVAVSVQALLPRLRHENFARIQVGMSLQEVEDLLGGPPGEYGLWGLVEPLTDGMMSQEGVAVPPGSTELVWFDASDRFEVWFDPQNTVVAVHRRAIWQRGRLFGMW
jgi:hypothetical protein